MDAQHDAPLHVLRREPVPEAVRRIARARIERSLGELEGEARIDAIHGVRKQCKQLRALLRLVRAELGEAIYARENERFRELARPLTEVRDAEVLVETLDALSAHFTSLAHGRFIRLREALVAQRDALHAAALAPGGALERAAEKLREAQESLGDWQVPHPGWRAVGDGVSRAYRRSRKAMRAAETDPTDARLHRWRKEVKYLRGQLVTLKPHWPKAVGAQIRALDALGELLGNDHDLAVLRQVALTELSAALDPSESDLLSAMVAHRRAQLQKKAFRRGGRWLGRRPRPTVRALHHRWSAWHDA